MRSGFANRAVAVFIALLLVFNLRASWASASSNDGHAKSGDGPQDHPPGQGWEEKFRSIPTAEATVARQAAFLCHREDP